jgi:hypothetical protein
VNNPSRLEVHETPKSNQLARDTLSVGVVDNILKASGRAIVRDTFQCAYPPEPDKDCKHPNADPAKSENYQAKHRGHQRGEGQNKKWRGQEKNYFSFSI